MDLNEGDDLPRWALWTGDSGAHECTACGNCLDRNTLVLPHYTGGVCYPALYMCADCLDHWVHGAVGPDGRTRVGGAGTCPNCRNTMVDDYVGDVPEDGDQEALPSPLHGQGHVADDDGDESDYSQGVYEMAEALALRIEVWVATHAPAGTTRINPIIVD